MGSALLVFVLLVLSSAPARLASAMLTAWYPQLILTETSGTLWRGDAAHAWIDLEGKQLPLGQLEWRLNPWSLFIVRPVLNIQSRYKSQSIDAKVAFSITGQLTINKLQLNFPLEVLKPWYPLLLDGTMSIELENTHVVDNWPDQLEGQAILSAARWRMSRQAIALGDYRAELSDQDEHIRIVFNDQNADLGIDGQLQLTRNGDYQTNLIVERNSDAVSQIFGFLAVIGEKTGPDSLRITRDGRVNLGMGIK